MSIFFSNPYENIIMFFVFYAVGFKCMKKYCFNLLDPIWMTIFSMTISLLDLLILYRADYMDTMEYIKVSTLIVSFAIGVLFSSKFFNRTVLKNKLNVFLEEKQSQEEKNFFYVIYIIFIAISLFFVIALGDASVGDERISIAARFRLFDIIKQGTNNMVFLTGFILYIKSKEKRYIYLLLVAMSVIAFSGAKGFLVSAISIYLFFEGVRRKSIGDLRHTIKIYFKYILIGIIILISMMFVMLYWGKGFEEAYTTLFVRIFMASDAYLYGYVYGDYKTLYEKYNFITYILHPFLRFFGVRGYEYPVGVELFASIGKGYDGFGPNPVWPMLILIIMNGQYFFSFIITLLLGVAAGFMVNFISRYISSRRNYLFNYYLLAIYMNGFHMFTDLGGWQQRIISITIVFVLVNLFINILKKNV